LINKGERQNLWKFKEKPNELVQKETPREGAAQAPSASPVQPSIGKNAGGNKEAGSWNATDGSGNRIQTTR
jgi:hypothetical protein